MGPKYYVTTYDMELGVFTPQKGVRIGPYSLFGLRKPLRKLRGMGYSADRDDPSIYVSKDEMPPTVEEEKARQKRIEEWQAAPVQSIEEPK